RKGRDGPLSATILPGCLQGESGVSGTGGALFRCRDANFAGCPVGRLYGDRSGCINSMPGALAISNTGRVNANRIRWCKKAVGRVKAGGSGLASPHPKNFPINNLRRSPEQERRDRRLERERTARSLHPKGDRKAASPESDWSWRRTTRW